jgi:hypothetical protein
VSTLRGQSQSGLNRNLLSIGGLAVRGVASGSRRESRSTCGALMKALPPARTAALALAVNGFAEWRSRWQREAMLALLRVVPQAAQRHQRRRRRPHLPRDLRPPNANGTPLS